LDEADHHSQRILDLDAAPKCDRQATRQTLAATSGLLLRANSCLGITEKTSRLTLGSRAARKQVDGFLETEAPARSPGVRTFQSAEVTFVTPPLGRQHAEAELLLGCAHSSPERRRLLVAPEG